jgi:DivIVA domain-containing protein
MPLTPADVRNKQFSTTRLRPGYDEEEVDAFLDEVEAELDRLIQENEELRAKLAECLRGKVPAMAAPIIEPKQDLTPIPEPPRPIEQKPEPELIGMGMAPPPHAVAPMPSMEDGMDTAARVLALAQQTADQAIADARREAEETVGRARREAEDILGKARRQSDQLVNEARGRAATLEQDATDRHRQAMGTLVQTREELERKVDDLRAFEREYRSRLRAYLEGQLRELEAGANDSGPFGAGPVGTGPQPAAMAHGEVPNGRPAVGPATTGPNPFPASPVEIAHHAAQHGTGGFHTVDGPPHDRR